MTIYVYIYAVYDRIFVKITAAGSGQPYTCYIQSLYNGPGPPLSCYIQSLYNGPGHTLIMKKAALKLMSRM
jgi:hypothetical protein